jgi:nucleotide-binding universal stress UspA family protein
MNSIMKTILALTDYTDCSKNAVNYACKLAQQMDASLILYHSFFVPAPDPEVPVSLPSTEELMNQNTALIKKVATELTDVFGVKVDYYTNFLPVVSELKDVIKQYHVDLVVMGRKRAKNWEYTLFGSTADAAIRYSTCPVLIVPEGIPFKPLSHILFACDYTSISEEEKLGLLAALASRFTAQIRVLHVDSSAFVGPKIYPAHPTINLERVFAGIKHSYEFIEEDDIIEGIEEGVSEYTADLLVMVSKAHTFWDMVLKRSTTRKMLFHTQIPLLSIPD